MFMTQQTAWILGLSLSAIIISLVFSSISFHNQAKAILFNSFLRIKTPVCILNHMTNKIISTNQELDRWIINLFGKSNVTSITEILDFKDYMQIKKLTKVNRNFDKIVKLISNNITYYIMVRSVKIKIGFNSYMVFIFDDISNELVSLKYLGILSAILDNGPDGIIISRVSDKINLDKYFHKYPVITYSNNKVEECTGYSSDEIYNKPLNVILESNVSFDDLNEIKEAILSMEQKEMLVDYIKKDGTKTKLVIDFIPITSVSAVKSSMNMLRNYNRNHIDNNINLLDDDDDVFIVLHQSEEE